MKSWLKAMRTSAGLTQGEMSKIMGITQAYFCDIENGRKQSDMTYSMMEKLAKALQVPVQAIIDAESARKSTRANSA